MTFLKYVDLNLGCFIPGKVIDEIISVLRTIKKDENPPRAYEILQELRDISSMAMEYFDDKIFSTLKVQLSPLRFGGSARRRTRPSRFTERSWRWSAPPPVGELGWLAMGRRLRLH